MTILETTFTIDTSDSSLQLEEIEQSQAPAAVNFSGTFCHTDISSVVSGVTDFGSSLESNLNTTSPSGNTYTVAWDQSTAAYTVTVSPDVKFALITTGGTTEFNRIYGLTAASSVAVQPAGSGYSVTSNRRPWYCLLASLGSSDVSHYQKRVDSVDVLETEGGTIIAQRMGSRPAFYDFMFPLEAEAITFSSAGVTSTTIPYTFDNFIAYVRSTRPIAMTDDYASRVLRLTPEGSAWSKEVRRRSEPNNDAYWDWTFRTYYLGEL